MNNVGQAVLQLVALSLFKKYTFPNQDIYYLLFTTGGVQ